MCGIFGYSSSDDFSLDKNAVRAMGKAIRHRGPDDHGEFFGPNLALGNQRLSIIDLEGGHQPFTSKDGSIVLVQNGEIFNYIELTEQLRVSGIECETSSDTEVILRLYEKKGMKMLDDLNGMFAIAVYDKNKNSVFVARDRLGVKPLYYYQKGTTVIFASEIKAILAAGVKRELNPKVLGDYLQLGYVPPGETLFKNIYQLEPGNYLTVSEHGVEKKPWWSLASLAQENIDVETWGDEFRYLFSDAVKIRMRADVPFGAFLSGGLDSSWTVSQMKKYESELSRTYSVGFGGTKFDEAEYAKFVADQIGTAHKSIEFEKEDINLWAKAIYHCDQPHADLSFLPTLKVSALAAQDVKMVLSGDGADELFAGYTRYLKTQQAWEGGLPADLAGDQYKRNIIFAGGILKSLLKGEYGRQLVSYAETYDRQLKLVSHWDAVNQMLYLDMMNLLVGNNLVKPDRMGMAVSLEARPPFMDYRIVELAFRISGAQKLTGGETKFLVKESAKLDLHRDIVYRNKQMFTVPVTEWQSQGLASMARTLLIPSFANREIISSAAIEQMITAHEQSPHNFLRELRALVALELWLRIFFDGESLDSLEQLV